MFKKRGGGGSVPNTLTLMDNSISKGTHELTTQFCIGFSDSSDSLNFIHSFIQQAFIKDLLHGRWRGGCMGDTSHSQGRFV